MNKLTRIAKELAKIYCRGQINAALVAQGGKEWSSFRNDEYEYAEKKKNWEKFIKDAQFILGIAS